MTSFRCRVRGHVWQYVDQVRTCDRCTRREVGQLVDMGREKIWLEDLRAKA